MKRAPGVQATGPSPPLWAWNAIPCATSASGTGWMGIKGLQAMARRKTRPAAPPAASPSPSPREAGAEDSAATPAAARGGRNTPRRFIAAMRRPIPEPAPIVERRFRRMETTTAGIARTPAIFQTASIRQRRTGVQLSDCYLDIRPHMSDV